MGRSVFLCPTSHSHYSCLLEWGHSNNTRGLGTNTHRHCGGRDEGKLATYQQTPDTEKQLTRMTVLWFYMTAAAFDFLQIKGPNTSCSFYFYFLIFPLWIWAYCVYLDKAWVYFNAELWLNMGLYTACSDCVYLINNSGIRSHFILTVMNIQHYIILYSIVSMNAIYRNS